MKSNFQRVVSNLSPKVRRDSMGGRDFLVVPMVMITEGVHNGSNGPLYYSGDVISKNVFLWNHKPIVVYHPKTDGAPASACTPEVIDAQGVGVVMNATTKKDGDVVKLSAEAWLEESRLEKVDDRIISALEEGLMMELSTGLITEIEETQGIWNKKEEYSGVIDQMLPDHLAILPDLEGACSIKDGAGLLRNEKTTVNEASYNETRCFLETALGKESQDSYAYVEDMFQEFFIYYKDGKLWKRGYTSTDNDAVLGSVIEEVVRFTQYRSPSGDVVVNVRRDGMNKKKMVDSIIANSNGVWEESDREFLTKKSEEKLAILMNKKEDPKPDEVSGTETPAVVEVNNTVVAANTEDVSVDEYIAKAPKALREMLANGLRAHEVEKAKLIGVITSNKRNKFTKEQLSNMPLDAIQAIAEIAAPVENQSATYAGLADALAPTTVNQSVSDEEVLPLPVFDFAK